MPVIPPLPLRREKRAPQHGCVFCCFLTLRRARNAPVSKGALNVSACFETRPAGAPQHEELFLPSPARGEGNRASGFQQRQQPGGGGEIAPVCRPPCRRFRILAPLADLPVFVDMGGL